MLNIKLNTRDFDIKFPLLQALQKEKIRRVILKTGAKVIFNALQPGVAPKDIGTLRNTMSQEPDLKNFVTNISSDVDYDIYNEVRKPYLKPSLDKEKNNFIRDIKNALR